MSQYAELFDRQCARFSDEVRHRTTRERVARLRSIHDYIFGHQEALHECLYADFRKPAAEVDATEIYPVLTELRHAMRHLGQWMRPRHVDAPLSLLGTRSLVVSEPLGVVLIIAPWNFPFMLAIAPLVAAIAAGNCVTLKPSELTPRTADFIQTMVGALFPPEEVSVIQGGPDETGELLQLPFHHIFFTGSTRVGRIVMEQASRNLISVTLELGGKCPAIVDDSAAIEDTARKLVWGKFLNAGQACVAPDYVLVAESVREPLIEAMCATIDRHFPTASGEGDRFDDLCRIIDDGHFARLRSLLQQALESGAKVRAGGQLDASQRLITPTILTDVAPSADLLHEEIFGPLLPVVSYASLPEAIRFVEARPRPLSLYIFSRSKRNIAYFLENTASGGTAINDTMIHFLHPYLPFGGVNESGIGRTHGHHGFTTFSNQRSILRQSTWWTTIRPIYPPYTRWVRRVLSAMLRYL